MFGGLSFFYEANIACCCYGPGYCGDQSSQKTDFLWLLKGINLSKSVKVEFFKFRKLSHLGTH